MPKWSSDTDTGFLRTLEEVPSAFPPELPHVGAVFEKSNLGVGLADKIKEAADKAKARGGQKGKGDQLRVDELAGSTGLRVADSKLGLAEDRLDKARKFIKESKFNDALKILGEVLKENPNHSNALYLKGLCEFRLDRAEAALRTIAPVIRSTPLPLDSQMRHLRAGIREKMVTEVVANVFGLCMEGNVDAGLRRIQELLGLDPAVPIYHFLRVHLLLAGDQLSQASAAAEAAAPYCQGSDQEMLDSVRREILHRMLASALEPARLQYRAMNWRKARKELERIKSEWGHEDLWQVFYHYLEKLGGGIFSKGRQPAEVTPQGNNGTVDQLHFMLVREELGGAKLLLGAAHPTEARQVLLAANTFTPYFPYLHYMLGQATYLSLLLAIASDLKPELETVESQLQEALQFAKSGAQDPEIKAAKELIEAIQVAQKAIGEVRVEQKKQERDIALIRPLGDQFSSIMAGAKDGIESVEQFHQLRTQLRKMRADIPEARKKMETAAGRTALQQMEEAVDRNLAQLDKMEPKMQTAEQIIGFQKKLQSILSDGQVRDGSLTQVERSLRELKGEVEAYKRGHILQKDEQQVLDDLTGTIERFQGELAEAGMINPFMQKFDVAFSPLRNRSTPLNYSEARMIKTSMSGIVDEGYALLLRLSKPEARKRVLQVISVANDIVGKIPI